jgi:hypothetical protein
MTIGVAQKNKQLREVSLEMEIKWTWHSGKNNVLCRVKDPIMIVPEKRATITLWSKYVLGRNMVYSK